MTRNVYNTMLLDKMESNRIDDYYEMIKRFSIYTYLAIPVILWLKIMFIALLLQTPLLLQGIEVSFKETFRVSVYSNFPFVLANVVKLFILFLTPRVNYTIELFTSIPGSTTNFLSKEFYSPVVYSYLNNINIYKLLWILTMFYRISKLKNITKQTAFILVFCIWLLVIVFQVGLLFYINN